MAEGIGYAVLALLACYAVGLGMWLLIALFSGVILAINGISKLIIRGLNHATHRNHNN